MSVITIENKELNILSSNFIYSKSSSRPSKSIIDPDKYTKYKSIKQKFTFIDNPKNFLFIECLGYIFHPITKINENVYILDKESYKIIEFKDNNFKKLTEFLNDKYLNYIIIFNEIYTYPKIQYIYILSNYFKEITIIISQLMNYSLVICNKKIKDLDLQIKDNYIKDFDVKVDENVIKYIKEDNNIFLENTLNMNNIISNTCSSLSEISSLNREIYTINKYYKAFVNREFNTYCNCKINNIFYSNIFQCYICENCLILTRLLLF